MVLYELLSQHSPFDNIQPMKRNVKVNGGCRPTLQAKETRSLILLQDTMELCWEQEPENRPKMSQVSDWIQAPEFARLRAEISLREVKSISCACVCRILPEYERWGNEPLPLTVREGMKIYNSMEMNLEELQKTKLDEIGNFEGSNFRQEKFRSGSLLSTVVKEPGDNVNVKQFNPYTQIWMCEHDQRKELLHIFTYNDGHPGHYVSTTSLCVLIIHMHVTDHLTWC